MGLSVTSMATVALGASKWSKLKRPEERRVSSTHVMVSLTVATPTPKSNAN